MREDNAGIFDNVIGYGNGVDTDGTNKQLQDFGYLPRLDTPGAMLEDNVAMSLNLEHAPESPDVNPSDGYSRNYFLERLRNQHPFLTIDPPLTSAFYFNISNVDAEVVISVPQSASMHRITFISTNVSTAILAVSRLRGITAALATASRGEDVGLIIQPEKTWRACYGGELVFKNIGTGSRIIGSVEFFMQL